MTERANPIIQPSSRRWLIWLLIGLVVLAFGRICTHSFVHWDDDLTIWHNSAFNPPTWKVLRFWVMPYMGLYIPATYSIWGGLAYLSSIGASAGTPNPWIFHTASVLIHIGSALTVFAILKRLLNGRIADISPSPGTPGEGRGEGSSTNDDSSNSRKALTLTLSQGTGTGDKRFSPTTINNLAAFFGAGIFALHPIQVEAVAWASGMKDLLCGFFSLLAILEYIRFVQDQNGKWLNYFLGLLALLAAMLSKPTAIITPLMILIIDRWLIGQPWTFFLPYSPPIILVRPTSRNEITKRIGPWFVLAIPFAVIARLVQTTTGTPLTPLWTRPLIYTDAIAFYLLKLIWPIHLSLDYARSPVYAMQQGWIYWTWIFPVIAALLIIYFRKHKWLVAGALLFLVGWLPVSGLAGFLFQYYSTVADHYLYLPMFGVAIIAAYLVAQISQGEPGRPRPGIIFPICVLILAAYTVISFIQAGYWRDEKTLYEHTLAITPRSYFAHINLAMVLRNEGKFDEPEKLLIEATQQNPNYYQAWETLADLLSQCGQMDRAIDAEKHAIADCQLLGAPQFDRVREFDIFGQLLMKANRKDEAITQFQNALNLDPNYTPAKQHLHDAENAPAATQ